ncbi:reverse transcriptase family protein [Agrococcus carbonis]|uniref:reverse transcriptase family protein n=1 Tax=Agrococcus carbonis TaxID=684552 RepID=UPI0012F9E2C9|nr:reverse transcriptase family protein [Agrococcus carbonis]
MIERAIRLSTTQSANGVQPILTLKHLANQAGVGFVFLERVCDRSIDPYVIYGVRKRVGSSRRMIAAPEEQLRVVQRWLLDHVFTNMHVHSSAFAYVKGRSAPMAARLHLGANWMLKLDVRNFFHAFDERQVYDVLAGTGYSDLVRLQVARISTRHVREYLPWLPEKYRESRSQEGASAARFAHTAAEIDAFELTALPHDGGSRLGYLPQGAPSSGAISNLLSRELDRDLAELGISRGLVYTRYADDIALSASTPFSRKEAEALMHDASRALRKHGLEPNHTKTRIVRPGLPIELLGVRVDGEYTRVSRRVREKIEFHIRAIEKFGLAAHAAHAGFGDAIGCANHVIGLVRYAHDVEPQRAGAYFARIERAIPGLQVRPL